MRTATLYDLLPLPAYVCQECGSPEIQMQCWVMVNTDKILDDTGSYHWCNNCEEVTGDGEQKYLAQVTGVTADGGLTWEDF